MSNVEIEAGDHVMTIHFDPVEGARDYRLYAAPGTADVIVDGADPSRLIGVRNATYRCAGTHEAPVVNTDWHLAPYYNNCEVAAIVDSAMPYVEHCGTQSYCVPTAGGDGAYFGDGGYARRPSEAQLGWVYTSPGVGRAPVYVLGDPDESAYAGCYARNWTASRNKLYTTDAARADRLRAAGWMDLGIAFYVPMTPDASTQPIYTTELASSHAGVSRYYLFADGDERAFRIGRGQSVSPAFLVLRSAPPPAPDGTPTAQPLYRVLYSLQFATYQHDELGVGRARFEDLYGLGQSQTRQEITFSWSGDAPSGLVLEALDQGCPFQGHLAARELPATDLFEAWTSLESVRAASAHGEVYLNGQYDGTTPTPIARAFVGIESRPRRQLDFASDYETRAPVFIETPCVGGCDDHTLHLLQSDQFDVTFNGIEGVGDASRWSLLPMAGQLWTLFSDKGADVGAQLRMTSRTTAAMSSGAFLYATMEVDSITTARRYPQIIIHDRVALPLWERDRSSGTDAGRSLVLQSFADWPSRVTVEVCTNVGWAVNHQCPEARMEVLPNGLHAPISEQADRASIDHMSRFEIYASTQRAYVFFDGEPRGCVDFEPDAVPSGEVRVTFGDVLYHSGADEGINTVLPDGFLRRHEYTMASRHFGPLGFSSGVAPPEWDEVAMPCVRVGS